MTGAPELAVKRLPYELKRQQKLADLEIANNTRMQEDAMPIPQFFGSYIDRTKKVAYLVSE